VPIFFARLQPEVREFVGVQWINVRKFQWRRRRILLQLRLRSRPARDCHTRYASKHQPGSRNRRTTRTSRSLQTKQPDWTSHWANQPTNQPTGLATLRITAI